MTSFHVRSKWLLGALIFCARLFWVAEGHAHSVSDSQLQLDLQAQAISGEWSVGIRDLDVALHLDRNADGAVSDREVLERADIAPYLLSRLTLETPGGECDVDATSSNVRGVRLTTSFEATCPPPFDELSVRYELFFELDPAHRGRLRLSRGDLTHTAVLTHIERQLTFALDQANVWQSFRSYFREGVWHIGTGFDHLLFLLTLLLPAARIRRGREWLPAPSLRERLLAALRVVTAFTLAHSLTLCLAALGAVQASPRWVETAIALSVVLAAANNLYPLITHRGWLLAFGFGLVHGFGFAGVLAELGLGSRYLVANLLGFNLGVELGQVLVVALALPALFVLGSWRRFEPVVLKGGSVAALAVGLLWAMERASSPAHSAAVATTEAAVDGSSALRLGDDSLAKAEVEAAVDAYRSAAEAFERAGDDRQATGAYRRLAQALLLSGDETHAARYLRRAVVLARGTEDLPSRAADRERLGKLYRSQKRWTEALEEYRQALRAYQLLGDREGVMRAWLGLGHVHLMAHEHSAALEAYEAAEAQASGDQHMLADTKANLGNVRRELGQFGRARAYYTEALESYVALGEEAKAARVQSHLVGLVQEESTRRSHAGLLRP